MRRSRDDFHAAEPAAPRTKILRTPKGIVTSVAIMDDHLEIDTNGSDDVITIHRFPAQPRRDA